MYQGFELQRVSAFLGRYKSSFYVMEVCGVKFRSGFACGIRCVAGEMCGETAAFAYRVLGVTEEDVSTGQQLDTSPKVSS
jgi:hypothetical protein